MHLAGGPDASPEMRPSYGLGGTELSPKADSVNLGSGCDLIGDSVCISQNYFIDAFVNHDAR